MNAWDRVQSAPIQASLPHFLLPSTLTPLTLILSIHLLQCSLCIPFPGCALFPGTKKSPTANAVKIFLTYDVSWELLLCQFQKLRGTLVGGRGRKRRKDIRWPHS